MSAMNAGIATDDYPRYVLEWQRRLVELLESIRLQFCVSLASVLLPARDTLGLAGVSSFL
jgi:hypothetical protein